MFIIFIKNIAIPNAYILFYVKDCSMYPINVMGLKYV